MADLEKLKEKAASMPASPGVYLMKDVRGGVLYVGKAKTLPKRVTTYFQKNAPSVRIGMMVARVEDVDFIVTDTEKEALILENSLIKKHKPRYNIVLRDDKTYPSIRLTVQEDYPRLEVVRRVAKDGAVYFGPFSSASSLRQTLRLIRRLFPLRQCKRPDVKNVDRACLNNQLGRCLGPCKDHVTKEEYRALVDEVIMFFQGRNKNLTDALKSRMKKASESLNFERAAWYRDRLADVERTLEKQNVVSHGNVDQDVIGFARDRGQVMAAILFIRRGSLLGRRNIAMAGGGDAAEEVEALLGQYYGQDNLIPDEILVPITPPGVDVLQEWLKEKRGKSVRLISPVRGAKKNLLDLARQNAETALNEKIRAADLGVNALLELQRKLHLPEPPLRIECYDNSNLRGDSPVGAMVVLENGEWVKSDYRRFKIKSASGMDDYAMMTEVLTRRLSKEDVPFPDLLLLDGGRGQLSMAGAVIKDLELEDPPPIAGLAKGREEGEADKVWLPGRKNPVEFRSNSPALLMLMRIRDEAHRYVQSYHHAVRANTLKKSVLDDIPGVGPAKRKALLEYFGKLEYVKNAEIEEIEKVKGVNRTLAEEIFYFFNEKGE